jgi:hypothetical protein
MYRTWRDAGVRGFTPDGLPDQSFRVGMPRGTLATRSVAITIVAAVVAVVVVALVLLAQR